MIKINPKNDLDQKDIKTSSNNGDENCFFYVFRNFFLYRNTS